MRNIKVIPRENLIIRESFSIFYGGGELWVKQLGIKIATINDFEKAKEWLMK